MLIRRVTPKGATGSVYGLVYSGMDVGSALGPLAFGLLLDAGLRQGPWVGAGVAFAVAALLAQWIAVQARRADPVAAAPARPEARRSRRSVWRIAVGLSAGTMAATLLPAVRPAFLFAFLFVLRRIWRAHLLIPLSPSRACVWSTPRVAGATGLQA